MQTNTHTSGLLTQCPECSGTTGYRFEFRVEIAGKWGKEPGFTGYRSTTKTMTCRQCGYRMAADSALDWKLVVSKDRTQEVERFKSMDKPMIG